ncbi:MAG: MarR family transcriptional regulator [Aquirhabdus sp.]
MRQLLAVKMKNTVPDQINLLALDNQFCFALYSASLAMTKTYKPLLDKIGLTYPQYLVMMVLWEHDGILVKDIGEALFLDSGTLTPLLKRMETAELLTRNRDTHDERQVRINLTKQGKLLRKAAKEIPLQIMCASGLTKEALVNLKNQLSQVRNDLTESNKS